MNENESNDPLLGILTKEATNSDGNICKDRWSSGVLSGLLWTRNMDKTFIRLVGSLSRAMGNDLVDYKIYDDHYTLKIWGDIPTDSKNLVREIIREEMPKTTVRIESRKGLVTITKKS